MAATRRPRPQRRRRTPLARLTATLARQWATADRIYPGFPDTAAPWPVRLARHHLLPILAYLLIAAAVTYPLVRHFATSLPGDGVDAWQNVWDYWWLRRALATGQAPYRTDLLYAPYGAPLYLHTLNPFNGLVTLPVQLLFGLVPAYNMVVLLSLTLAAYFAYLLVAFASGGRAAGFAGGVIYAFGSYHLAHLLGHANLLASEWLPAYTLCLLAAPAATGRRRWLAIAGGILSLVLLSFCDWQYVLFAALFTALWAAWATVARRSVVPLATAAATGLLALLLLSPVLLPTLRTLRETAATRPAVPSAAAYPADLVSFFVPSPLQTWWGRAAETIGGRAKAGPVERAIFLGYAPLALAACGLWFGRRRAAFFAVAALAFALLALGPTLNLLGKPIAAVPMPYRLLQLVPVANIFRVPARFGLLVTLSLAVLAGLGLVGLARRFPALGDGRARLIALPLLVLLLLAEHFPAPYPLTPVAEPPFYRQLAASPEPGTVLELPLSMTRATSLFNQTIHGRPIVGGYLSRPLAYPPLTLPPFRVLSPESVANDIVTMSNDGIGEWMLRWAGVRWVVVLNGYVDRATEDFVSRYVEPEPLYQDGQMTVYRPKAPGAPRFYVRPADGWNQPETLADGRRMRWTMGSATLLTWGLSDGPQAGTLRFDAWSFNRPRRVAVLVDGQQIAEQLIADRSRYAIPLTLTPGQHTIELRTLDPPESPAQTTGGADTRLIAIGVTALELR